MISATEMNDNSTLHGRLFFSIIIYYPVLSGIKNNPSLNTYVSGFIFTFVYIILTGDQSPSVEQDYRVTYNGTFNRHITR